MDNKISIRIDEHRELVAEIVDEDICIGIQKDGYWCQDLACVRPVMTYSPPGCIPEEEICYEVLVWADQFDENYTDHVFIFEYKEEDECTQHK